MSNEKDYKNQTVLDMLEEQSQNFSNFVKQGWEHAVKLSGEKGIDLPETFRHYHVATTLTFVKTVADPQKLATLILGAVARELVNSMDDTQKAELACTTLEHLDYPHERHEDGKEE